MKKSLENDCIRIAVKENNAISHPEYSNYSHWTFVIQSNSLLGYGKNRSGKPFYTNFGYSDLAKIHSEADAYRKIKGILDSKKKFEIFNIRLNKQNDFRISKPCICCMEFLKFIGCNSVYFTTEIGIVRIKI